MDLSIEFFKEQEYLDARQLADGTWIAIMPMGFTWGLFIGLDKDGYRHRYCYQYMLDVLDAFLTWDGTGHPPGPWIKLKGVGMDLLGPGAVAEDYPNAAT